MKQLTVAIAADHRGFALKSTICTLLEKQGHTVSDFGTSNTNSCDAGDFAQKLAINLREHPEHCGILICGSGQAMAMTANRFKHLRAALCLNTTMARLAREHNDANVLVLGASIMGEEVAMDCVTTFLTSDFLGGRFTPRVEKLMKMGGL